MHDFQKYLVKSLQLSAKYINFATVILNTIFLP